MSAEAVSSSNSAPAARNRSVAAGAISLQQLPAHLLDSQRCADYCSAAEAELDKPELHLYSHFNRPAIYRAATFLWTPIERLAIQEGFPPGWTNLEGHPVRTCLGDVRLQTEPRQQKRLSAQSSAVVVASSAEEIVSNMTVAAALTLHDTRHRPFVMADISMHSNYEAMASTYMLRHGPALFQPFNLLAVTPPASVTHNHPLSQFNIATRGTHTNTHTDWYAADSAVLLLEGEKLWVMAAPSELVEFGKLFPSTGWMDITTEQAGRQFSALWQMQGGCAIVQKQGDVIYVPAGWPHLVLNLTNSSSIGWSYLRPFRLAECIQWCRKEGQQKSMSVANISDVFDNTLAIDGGSMMPAVEQRRLCVRVWGFPPEQLLQYRSLWVGLKEEWRVHAAKQSETTAVEALTSAAATLRNL